MWHFCDNSFDIIKITKRFSIVFKKGDAYENKKIIINITSFISSTGVM